jgi:3-oxoacyl-[acyl-carrier protein] reductase
MDLKGKRAIVTGSTKGIGLAVAKALLQSGASVVVCSRTHADVENTVRELMEEVGGVVAGTVCDVSDPAQVKELIDFTKQELGGLDVLINNAGIGIFRQVEEMTIDDWQKTIGINLNGVFYASHYAIPEMKRSGGGFIINIGSLAGKNAFPGGGAYNASKFGLLGFSEALMQEVRHDDIRVACIMPGSVYTDFSHPSGTSGGDSWKLTGDDVAEVVVETLTRHPRCLTSRIEMRPSQPPKK